MPIAILLLSHESPPTKRPPSRLLISHTRQMQKFSSIRMACMNVAHPVHAWWRVCMCVCVCAVSPNLVAPLCLIYMNIYEQFFAIEPARARVPMTNSRRCSGWRITTKVGVSQTGQGVRGMRARATWWVLFEFMCGRRVFVWWYANVAHVDARSYRTVYTIKGDWASLE